MNKPPSRRFSNNPFTSRLVPVLLVVLVLALLATLALIVLSIVGATPGA